MPYIVISSYAQVESGPTTVGGFKSDVELMKYLGAKLQYKSEYICADAPEVVLNKLKLIGYKVIAMAANETRCFWTLDKP